MTLFLIRIFHFHTRNQYDSFEMKSKVIHAIKLTFFLHPTQLERIDTLSITRIWAHFFKVL
jgi:hypothetical protein